MIVKNELFMFEHGRLFLTFRVNKAYKLGAFSHISNSLTAGVKNLFDISELAVIKVMFLLGHKMNIPLFR